MKVADTTKSEKIANKVMEYDNWIIIISLSINNNLSPEVLCELSKHRYWRVRANVACHPNVTLEMLERLSIKREDNIVRHLAIKKLREVSNE